MIYDDDDNGNGDDDVCSGGRSAKSEVRMIYKNGLRCGLRLLI